MEHQISVENVLDCVNGSFVRIASSSIPGCGGKELYFDVNTHEYILEITASDKRVRRHRFTSVEEAVESYNVGGEDIISEKNHVLIHHTEIINQLLYNRIKYLATHEDNQYNNSLNHYMWLIDQLDK
jgi:hypothetical protein